MCYKEPYYLLENFKISLRSPSLYIHKFLIIIHTEINIQQQLMKTRFHVKKNVDLKGVKVALSISCN